jgi:cyclase
MDAMKRIRIIPVLGIDRGRLVKTVRFAKPRYVGDPLMAIKIFNDKEVDELIVADIRATVDRREPDWAQLGAMAGECFMPMGYIGGIRTVDEAKRIFDLGIEKVGFSSAFMEQPMVVAQAAASYGSQSIVVCIDVRRSLLGRSVVTGASGSRKYALTAVEAACMAEQQGAGEIILHDMSREGRFLGYDLALIKQVAEAVSVPVVALGGARGPADLASAIQAGASAVAASSMFVYKRNDPRSILINYPGQEELRHELSRLQQA